MDMDGTAEGRVVPGSGRRFFATWWFEARPWFSSFSFRPSEGAIPITSSNVFSSQQHQAFVYATRSLSHVEIDARHHGVGSARTRLSWFAISVNFHVWLSSAPRFRVDIPFALERVPRASHTLLRVPRYPPPFPSTLSPPPPHEHDAQSLPTSLPTSPPSCRNP